MKLLSSIICHAYLMKVSVDVCQHSLQSPMTSFFAICSIFESPNLLCLKKKQLIIKIQVPVLYEIVHYYTHNPNTVLIITFSTV